MRLADDYSPLSAPPMGWNSDIVLARMVLAFKTLRRMPGGIGPRLPGGSWPAEFSDTGNSSDEVRKPPRAYIVTYMEQSLGWPGRYLAGEPKMADAVNTTALCHAYDYDIEAMMKFRTSEVMPAVKVLQAEADERWHAAVDAALAAADAWARERILEARGDVQRIENIKANAQIRRDRARAEIKRELIDIEDVVLDRTVSPTSLDRYCYRGTARIAAGLNRDRIALPPDHAALNERTSSSAEPADERAVSRS